MTDNHVFTSLLAEIASQLGVAVSLDADEALTIDFEDGMTGVVAHLEDRRQILLEAGMPLPGALSERQSADLACLLLRMNALLMSEQSMSIATGTDNRIMVIRVISQEAINAIGLADAFETVVEKGRWVRSLLDQLAPGGSDPADKHPQGLIAPNYSIQA